MGVANALTNDEHNSTTSSIICTDYLKEKATKVNTNLTCFCQKRSIMLKDTELKKIEVSTP